MPGGLKTRPRLAFCEAQRRNLRVIKGDEALHHDVSFDLCEPSEVLCRHDIQTPHRSKILFKLVLARLALFRAVWHTGRCHKRRDL